MFGQSRGKESHWYIVPDSLARSWPDLLEREGLRVDTTIRWALKCSEFNDGLPSGDVADDNQRLGVATHKMDSGSASLNFGEPIAGTYIQVAVNNRNAQLAERVGAALVREGAVLKATHRIGATKKPPRATG